MSPFQRELGLAMIVRVLLPGFDLMAEFTSVCFQELLELISMRVRVTVETSRGGEHELGTALISHIVCRLMTLETGDCAVRTQKRVVG